MGEEALAIIGHCLDSNLKHYSISLFPDLRTTVACNHMIAIHPRFLMDEGGRLLAVQVDIDKIPAPWSSPPMEAGKVSEGEAATMLGVSRPEFLCPGGSRWSFHLFLAHTPESMEAELANL